MATAVQKIILSSARDIPFNKLVLSQSNVRRVKAGVSIEELADSIARRGLIQSLHVRPVLDADGVETGTFEVPAGGRRYRALDLLVKQKRLAKTSAVPCVVGDANSDILIDEVSLAENLERAPLHPLDQFRAFQAMRDKGMTEDAIAAAFLVAPQIVKQRLKLVSVAPALLDLYAEDAMTLEQLMAFSITNDHARQEQVWEIIRGSWQNHPTHIRRMLTENAVAASDKRARFVGLAAYEAEGGCILRDLFEHDEGGWLQDPVLLNRLVDEKLTAQSQAIAAEGWKWVEIATSFPYGFSHGLRKIVGLRVDLNEDEAATALALEEEYARIESEYEGADEYPDEIDTRMGEIEAALAAFDNRPLSYEADEVPIAGVFVSIASNGTLAIDRGYVRPDDEAPAEPEHGDDHGHDGDVEGQTPGVQRAVITLGGQTIEPDDEEDEGLKPLPERLVIELTAHRTLALRDTLANNPRIAMTLLLHKLASDTFRHTAPTGCLEGGIRHQYFQIQSDDMKECPSALAENDRHERWGDHVPADDQPLWDWLEALDDGSRLDLLAHCVSFGVNARFERPNPHSGSGISQHSLDVRLAQADRLARATDLDMVGAGWTPTVGNYLGRVTKPRILEAVREGAGERAAQLISHLKKGDMAKEAERLLAETGWLPEPLRLVELDGDVADADDAGDGDALPDFLVGDGDDDEATETEDEQVVLVAAE